MCREGRLKTGKIYLMFSTVTLRFSGRKCKCRARLHRNDTTYLYAINGGAHLQPLIIFPSSDDSSPASPRRNKACVYVDQRSFHFVNNICARLSCGRKVLSSAKWAQKKRNDAHDIVAKCEPRGITIGSTRDH